MEVNLHSQDSSQDTRFMLASITAGEALEVLTQLSLSMVIPTPWLTCNYRIGSGHRQMVTDQLGWILASIVSLSGLEPAGMSQLFSVAIVLTLRFLPNISSSGSLTTSPNPSPMACTSLASWGPSPCLCKKLVVSKSLRGLSQVIGSRSPTQESKINSGGVVSGGGEDSTELW